MPRTACEWPGSGKVRTTKSPHLDKMRRDVAPQKVAKWCTPPLACDAMPLTIRATPNGETEKIPKMLATS